MAQIKIPFTIAKTPLNLLICTYTSFKFHLPHYEIPRFTMQLVVCRDTNIIKMHRYLQIIIIIRTAASAVTEKKWEQRHSFEMFWTNGVNYLSEMSESIPNEDVQLHHFLVGEQGGSPYCFIFLTIQLQNENFSNFWSLKVWTEKNVTY